MQRTLTVLLLFSIMLMASIAAASAQASDHYDVYAVGFCSKGQGYRVTGYWKNREWHALPNPLVCGKPDAFLIAVSGKDVYAAGSCGTSGLGYWKNDSWN